MEFYTNLLFHIALNSSADISVVIKVLSNTEKPYFKLKSLEWR